MSGLVSERRFGPFFWTQSFGAFNDNVFKQALIIMITYQGISMLGLTSEKLVALAALIFIFPFFLLSATAGQVAEKIEKSWLIRRIKIAEIILMSSAVLAFYLQSIELLMLVLFLMGGQSAFFGPVKYSIIPQVLKTEELVKGNGLISMATFVSILLGSLLGGALIRLDVVLPQYDWIPPGWTLVAVTVVVMAILGFRASRRIPEVPVSAPDLKIDLNIFRQTFKMIGYARENPTVFRSILGVSWFWFFGSIMLTQFTPLIKDRLLGNEFVSNLVFAVFSIGIAVGSLLCDKLSRRRVEIGLVPLGAIGMSLFGVDLYYAVKGLEPVAATVGIADFIARDGSFRLLFDVLLLGASGGLYIVPLNALIQHRSDPEKRSRVIAGANIMNALFMVVAGIYSIVLLSLGLTVLQLILVTVLLNIAVAIYIFALVPEFLLRFAAWVLINTIYKIDLEDLHKIPEEGPVLLVCNHVSFADALVIGGSLQRPARFVMYYKIFNWPILGVLFRLAKAIPIAGAREDQEVMDNAFDQISKELDAGEVVCIFPEGRLTDDGEIKTFRRGVERILERNPVPVVPMALSGLWGSFFSRSDGGAFRGPMRKFLNRISLRVGDPVPPEKAAADLLQDKVAALWQPQS